MAPLACPDDCDLLAPVLDENAETGLREHVETCPYCRQRMSRLLTEVANLRRVARKADLRARETCKADPATTWLGEAKPTGDGPSARSEAASPQVIEKYKVIGLLGEGGQAVVYRVVHPGLSKELVLKLSRLASSSERRERDRLVQEAQLLADLDHPNLARVYDVGFWQDRPFIVMEYLRGRSLAGWLRDRKPAPRQVAGLVAQLARALAAAHRNGVIHLDLKPANIMLDEDGRPRVLDFGMARMGVPYAADAPNPVLGGTPDYMAPEQARGDQKAVGPASDVFALGAVLYEMLVGRAPFHAPTAQESLQRARRCRFDRSALRQAGVPRELERICLQALADEPAGRPAGADALADALERYVNRPRLYRRVFAIGLLLLLLGSVAGYLLLNRPVAFPAGPQSVVARVDRGQMAYELLTALPLRTGDQLRIDCPLPRGFRPRVFTCDVDGTWEEYSKFTVKSDGRFDRVQADVHWTGMTAGTRVILVCAGPSRPPEDLQETALAGEGAWEALPPRVAFSMDREEVRLRAADRQPLEAAQKTPVGRTEDRLDRLRARLRPHCAYFVGVVYPHAGE